MRSTNSLTARRTGVLLAALTAVISGFAVFINGYGVRAWAGTASPTAYTTLKNGVAALVLLSIGMAITQRKSREGFTRPAGLAQWLGLGLVATLGGALAFALFFEGLALATSAQGAFIHKTLVIWVGILAVGLLHEKVRPMHIAAIGLLVGGQVILVGGISDITIGMGEAMILGATLLWSIEIILAKRLLGTLSSLTVGVARMAGGTVILITYGIVNGSLAAVGTVSATQIGWVLVTGVILSGYVAAWYAALARAPALDVSSILVVGALITLMLRSAVAGAAVPSPLGMGLVVAGAGVAMAVALRVARDGPTVEVRS
jgi:drug/metabolite transporter (DMT)-like permease